MTDTIDAVAADEVVDQQQLAEQVLRYRDLGPIELARDGSAVKVPAGRLTTALGVLLVQANYRVSTDGLLHALWGDQLRGQETQTLESHMWRLRKILEPEHRPREQYSTILHNAQGYQLLAARDNIDSLRFERLAAEAGGLVVSGQWQRVRTRCEEALGLWRGRPWSPHSDADWAAPAVARLDELRGEVSHQRIDALLWLGQVPLALAELEVLIDEQPLHEKLWSQRMLGLYRDGRTEQALLAFQRLRALLIDELGVEPGPEIRSLQARILADDPTLAVPASAVDVVTASDRGPDGTTPPESRSPGDPVATAADIDHVQLPHRRTDLIGRGTQIAELAGMIATSQLVSVVGSAGCGKTSVAIEAGRRAAAQFVDGVVFVDLTAATEASQLVDAVCSAVRLPASAAESTRQSLVAFTRTRRMLLVMDNCEQLLEDVAELCDILLGPGTELVILTTSREPLNLDDERVFTLSPLAFPTELQVHAADLDSLSRLPAVELFLTRLKSAVPDLDIGESGTRLAADICAAVDGVPLAIELAAAQARSYTLSEILDRVRGDLAGLARIGRGATPHHSSLRAAIDLSAATLTQEEAAMHHAISVVPGPVTSTLAAALTASSASAAASTLGRLVHRSMLTALGPNGPARPSQFAQLATIRSHGFSTLSPESQTELEKLRDNWVLHLVGQAPRVGDEHEADWVSRISDHTAAVRATLHHLLVDRPGPAGVFLAARLSPYWFDLGMITEWERWARLACAVPDQGNTGDRTHAEISRGAAMALMGRTDFLAAAVDTVEHRFTQFTTDQKLVIGDHVLGYGLFAWSAGDADVLMHAEHTGRILATHTDDKGLLLMADAVRLSIDIITGEADPPEAQQRAQQLLEQAHQQRNLQAGWIIAAWGTMASILASDPVGATRWSTQMLHEYRRPGIGGISTTLELRAAALTISGHYSEAVQIFSASRSHARRAGLPWPWLPVPTELSFKTAADALTSEERDRSERTGAGLTMHEITHSN